MDGTGEHPNGRKAMDALIKRQIDHGVDPAKATERARKTAQEMDRKNYGRT